ncbi:hypothetical protein PPC_0657 [Pseudomonas protegens Cab57]|nr:hypothetical protein PPC_0657 [Pseudomonas protegens Cab57]
MLSSASLAAAEMVPVGRVRAESSAWAGEVRAIRQRLGSKYLFIGTVNHFFERVARSGGCGQGSYTLVL